MSEKKANEESEFLLHYDKKSVLMILLLWLLKRRKCNNPAKDYVNDI